MRQDQSTAGMIPTPQGLWFPRNVQQREFPPTPFNACLNVEKRILQTIQDQGGLLAICPGRKYTEPPWVRMPVQGKRFSKIGSIALPPNDGTDYLVNSWRVPQGYDGVIATVVFEATDVTGYVQGSGDLIWRLQLNQRWVKDYGNLSTPVGSTTTPYGGVNTGQILLQSGQIVQAFVNHATTSSCTGGRIITAQFGWTWPR